MNGPTRTWNAVVVGEDTPCWPGTSPRTDYYKKPSTATSAAA